MSQSKNKKYDKMTVIGFAVNFCAIFSLILVTGLLLVADAVGGSRSGAAALSAAGRNGAAVFEVSGSACTPIVPAVLFPVSAAAPVEGMAEIVIDDAGFSVNELNLALSSSKMVKIANRGSKPHSFVVDELGINTQAIAPGELVTVAFDNLPQHLSSFNFRSGIEGDSSAGFAGVVIVK